MLDKEWIIKDIPKEDVKQLAQRASISEILARVLLSRGIKDPTYIKSFLNPSLDELHDPFLLKDMDRAVERICTAVESKERIIIYGDYDVDGITSTSILYNFLKKVDANVDYFIPDRMTEGYGLTQNAIDRLLKDEVSLIVTVDCGCTSNKEVSYINEKNIDIIVTDHHECNEKLPPAYALINTNRTDCNYPFKGLAGVGVTFKLINAICIFKKLGDRHLDFLEFVAVGSVADVVPLIGENRVIVKYGLEKLSSTKNIGLKALIEKSGLGDKAINSWDIAFGLAPRINAAGRISEASRAIKLFTTENIDEASNIAIELNDNNKLRQEIELGIMNEVLETIDKDGKTKNEKVIIACGDGWHHGIIGIVASKITDRYNKPSFLISVENGIGRSSVRSIEGFDVFKALCHCGNLLARFGGHEMAGGFSIEESNIDEFTKVLLDYAESNLDDEHLKPRIKADSAISGEEISLDSVKSLELLAPFGNGNPSPIFVINMLRIYEIRAVGDGKHLKLKLNHGKYIFDAIAFNMGELASSFYNSDYIDIICSLEINSWNSKINVQFVIKDIKKSCENLIKYNKYYKLDKSLDLNGLKGDNIDSVLDVWLKRIQSEYNNQDNPDIYINRSDLESVYKYIKSFGNKEIVIENLFDATFNISEKYNIDINYFKFNICINVFQELEIWSKKDFKDFGVVIKFNDYKKVILEDSRLYCFFLSKCNLS